MKLLQPRLEMWTKCSGQTKNMMQTSAEQQLQVQRPPPAAPLTTETNISEQNDQPGGIVLDSPRSAEQDWLPKNLLDSPRDEAEDTFLLDMETAGTLLPLLFGKQLRVVVFTRSESMELAPGMQLKVVKGQGRHALGKTRSRRRKWAD